MFSLCEKRGRFWRNIKATVLLCIARSWTGEGGGTVTLALQNYAFGNFDIITHFLCFNNLGNVL